MTEVRSYHGQPVLKQPVWTGRSRCYFFTGGLAGASAGLALSVRAARQRGARAARLGMAALAAIGVSPALLISDLGRARALLEHAADVQGDLADERGLVDPVGERGGHRGRRGQRWTGLFPRASRVARPAAALLGLPLSHLHGGADRQHRGAGLARGAPLAAVRVRLRRGAQRRRGGGRGHAPEHARPARRLALAAAVVEVASKEADAAPARRGRRAL